MAWNWPWKRASADPNGQREMKNTAMGGFVAWHAPGDASWTRRDFCTLSREGYMRNPVVHRSVKLVAETAAAIPWLLHEGAREFDAHPLIELLRNPNVRQSGPAFMEAVYGHLLLAGNAYLELVGEGPDAHELHLLRPDRVRVATDPSGWPVRLDVDEGAVKRSIALDGINGAQARHLTLFHPLDDVLGFPPLEAGSAALDLSNSAARWNKALLDNSARPSGALVYAPKEGGNLTDEQYERLKQELENGYAGAARAGMPLLLEGGLDWKSMGLTPKDMDFIEAKNAASRDIALAFGVPPMLLGIPGDNTYSNYREANRAFYRLTVLPLVARVANDLNAWLAPHYGKDLRLWYDADKIDGMASDRDALWARIGAADFLTDDEKREALGYRPLRRGAEADR